MKNAERMFRTLHATTTLDGTSLSSQAVADARASLEKATSALSTADAEELAKKAAVREASARVRDATAKAFDACRAGHASIVAQDTSFDEKLSRDMMGRHPRALLAKAYFLIVQGAQRGLSLPALAAARTALAASDGGHAAAKDDHSAAVVARLSAEDAWDTAYTWLRSVVQAELAAKGVHGKKLGVAVRLYFPKQLRAPSVAAPSGETAAAAPEKKPAA